MSKTITLSEQQLHVCLEALKVYESKLENRALIFSLSDDELSHQETARELIAELKSKEGGR